MLIYTTISIGHRYKILQQRMYTEINIALHAIRAFLNCHLKWYVLCLPFITFQKLTVKIKLKYDEKYVLFI